MARRPIDFREIRKMVPPIEALSLCGWEPVWRRGGLSRGPCPFHGSSSPQSRILSVSVQVVYCHKCHWTGDAVAIFARLKSLPNYEAAEELCDALGIEIPYLARR